jgi:ATP/maltotriose-dependent transcriptional regulator MalT
MTVLTMFRHRVGRAAVVSRPALWERLRAAARVTLVSAPPGSGKTVLLWSWIGQEGLAEHLYAKLGAHSRAEAVESARALGLLAPSAPTRRRI